MKDCKAGLLLLLLPLLLLLQVVEYLISVGADVNAAGLERYAPLHRAVEVKNGNSVTSGHNNLLPYMFTCRTTT